MTFLQPYILWGLPLVLLPVIIHLLNRLRHRPQQWGAMRFLLSANRTSISNAKLRHFLILAMRVLAVLMLVLFLSRPLAGGWLGWALSPAPGAIVVLLDRSASMEAQFPGSSRSSREQAVELIQQAAKTFEDKSQLILIDSATVKPQELAQASDISAISNCGPTDTAADLPAMLQAAAKWLIDTRAGTAEIWIVSDGQKSNWFPEDSRWKSAVEQLDALPQKVRIRLLAMDQRPEGNVSLRLAEAFRRQRGKQAELDLLLDFQHDSIPQEPLPVQMTVDGAPSGFDLRMESQSMRLRQRVPLSGQNQTGFGSVQLPLDSNPRDNQIHFVYGSESKLSASVVSRDLATGRFLQLAAATLSNGVPVLPVMTTSDELEKIKWDELTLLIWQDSLPTGAAAERIELFVREGGEALFLAPGRPDSGRILGLGWGALETAAATNFFRITRWDEEQGPLARTDERLSLPLKQVNVIQRQLISEGKNVLAAFEDGAPFLTRLAHGKGELFFLASLPNPSWSSLHEGTVLVPLVQRLLQAGARRLQETTFLTSGEISQNELAKQWTCLGPDPKNDIRFHAGIYRSGQLLVAVNRPAVEDEGEFLESPDLIALFGNLPVQFFSEGRKGSDKLQGEIWRWLLVLMLGWLAVEGWLTLPPKRVAVSAPKKRAELVVETLA